MNYMFWWDQKYEEYKKIQPKLLANVSCDWLIIGGGLSGLFAALELVKQNQKNIVIIEKFECGRGTTGASTGFVTPDTEAGFSDLSEHFGTTKATWLWNYVQEGCDLLWNTNKDYKLDTDIEKMDSILIAANPTLSKDINAEYSQLQHQGLPATLLNKSELSKLLTSSVQDAVTYSNTYGMDPLLYAHRLKEYLLTKGVTIYEHTTVNTLDSSGAFAGGYHIKFKHTIVTTNKPGSKTSKLSSKISGVQSSNSVSRVLTPSEISSVFPSGHKKLIYDTREFYLYWRLTSDNRIVLGMDSLTTLLSPLASQRLSPVLNAQKELARLFPQLAHIEYEHYWSEIIDGTYDLIPLIYQEGNITYSGGNVGLPWAARTGTETAKVAMGAEVPELLSKNRVPFTMFGDNPYLKIAQYALYFEISKYFPNKQ